MSDMDFSRIQTLVDRPGESLSVELKRWIDPASPEGKEKIVKTALALRNYGGGYLAIGFDDATLKPDTNNVPRNVREDFHIDKIQALISKYASEPFEVSIEFPEREGQLYPVIVIPPGVKTPVAVKSDLRSDDGGALISVNDVYTRSLRANNTPSTTRPTWKDWPNILEVCFEAVSKILAEQDEDAAEVDEAEVVGGMIFIPDHEAPEVAQPGEEPLDLPPPLGAAQGAAILRFRFGAIAPMRSNHVNAQLAEASVKRVGVIRPVADEARRQRRYQPILQCGHYEGDLVGRRTLGADGERKTSAVCHCQELRPLAPLGLAHGTPPFWAAMNVPSMKHSLRSRPPRSCKSSAKACRTRTNVPSRTQP